MISRFTKSFLVVIVALAFVASLAVLHAPSRAYIDPWTGDLFGEGGVENQLHALQPLVPQVDSAAHGGVIMSKLGNETAKRVEASQSTLEPPRRSRIMVYFSAIVNFAVSRHEADIFTTANAFLSLMLRVSLCSWAALGRATWKLLHTMTLRYPESPTQDERDALFSYFHLFSRLYPCGECAAEFQLLLKKYPPQTSSRRSASLWLCHVHNRVNERLKKPIFDCAYLDDTYDCGCGDAPLSSSSTTTSAAKIRENDPMDLERDPSRDEFTGVGMVKGGR
ncbi:hypothetical protein EW146_g2343 [Bondarzewia mesenterica]|uniref:Sulfhydryl oxidase n=1 Tax=Bondarzewia mesenterica TaxID=1095465 RepID=A0A4S4M388_9AGAM|nr:hypothetical protein EW146_g2343 [Bondarzewia mesenterica]